MNSDLQRFVREALENGHSRESIRATLTAAHWRSEEVDAALGEWAESDFPLPVPRRKSQMSAREAFLHLVMFATLYTAALNTGAILFDRIERWLPDAAAEPWRREAGPEALRWAVAALLIALPVFLYTQRLIGRALQREPEQRGSGVRRWLTYLTLFVTALVLIGDFVAVLRGFLSGELVPRFLLKALTVGLIAGVGFRYYLSDLRRDETDVPLSARANPWLGRVGVAGMVLAGLAGLLTLGAPRNARLHELDQRRVNALSELSINVEDYRNRIGRLPADLDQLAASPAQRARPERLDPVTHAPYEYRTLDSLRYVLCAGFATADSIGPANSVSGFWRHPAGQHCFTFELPLKH